MREETLGEIPEIDAGREERSGGGEGIEVRGGRKGEAARGGLAGLGDGAEVFLILNGVGQS